MVDACRRGGGVRFSITARPNVKLRVAIEAIPDQAWSAIPYWLDGGADVAETSYTPFAGRGGAVARR